MDGFWAQVALGVLALAGCSSGGSDAATEPQTLEQAKRAFCSGFCDSGRGCGAADDSCEFAYNRDWEAWITDG